jgi:GNAT superfamily N-acetyltransferase
MSIEWRPADDPDVLRLATAQQRELDGQNPADHVAYPLKTDIEFVVALRGGEPVACGALQRLDRSTSEIKRMYVIPEARGAGWSRVVLSALESEAEKRGCTEVRLETALMFTAAVALYRSAGYQHIPAYGEYVGDPLSYCMAKPLGMAEPSGMAEPPGMAKPLGG